MKLNANFMLILMSILLTTMNLSNVKKMITQIKSGDLAKEDVLNYYNKQYDQMLELHSFFNPCLVHLISQETKNNSFLSRMVDSVKEIFSNDYEVLNFPDLGIVVKCETYINKIISEDYISKKKSELQHLKTNLLFKKDSNLKTQYLKRKLRNTPEKNPVENYKDPFDGSCEKSLEIYKSENQKLIDELKDQTQKLNEKVTENKNLNDEKCKCEDKLIVSEKNYQVCEKEKIVIHEKLNYIQIFSKDKTLIEKEKIIREKDKELKTIYIKIHTLETRIKECENPKPNPNPNPFNPRGNGNSKKCEEELESLRLSYNKIKEENITIETKILKLYEEININIKNINDKDKEIDVLKNKRIKCKKEIEILMTKNTSCEDKYKQIDANNKKCLDDNEEKSKTCSTNIKKFEEIILGLKVEITKLNSDPAKLIQCNNDLKVKNQEIDKLQKDLLICNEDKNKIKSEWDIKYNELNITYDYCKKQKGDIDINIQVYKNRVEECQKINQDILIKQKTTLEEYKLKFDQGCNDQKEILNKEILILKQYREDDKIRNKKICDDKINEIQLKSIEIKEKYDTIVTNYNIKISIGEQNNKKIIELENKLKLLISEKDSLKRELDECINKKPTPCNDGNLKVEINRLNNLILENKEYKKKCDEDYNILINREKKYKEEIKECNTKIYNINIEHKNTLKIEIDNQIIKCREKNDNGKRECDKQRDEINKKLEICTNQSIKDKTRIEQLEIIYNYKSTFEDCMKDKELIKSLLESEKKLRIELQAKNERDSNDCKNKIELYEKKSMTYEEGIKRIKNDGEKCITDLDEKEKTIINLITKIKRININHLTQLTKIKNYYDRKESDIIQYINIFKIEIKNLNESIQNNMKKRNEKVLEKEKIKRLIEEQRNIIISLTRSKMDLLKELEGINNKNFNTVIMIKKKIDEIEITINNTYEIIEKNTLIFEENCGLVSELTKEIEILNGNIEFYQKQQNDMDDIFKNLKMYISSLEELIKEKQQMQDEFEKEISIIIKRYITKENVNKILEQEIEKLKEKILIIEGENKQTIIKYGQKIDNLQITIQTTRTNCNNQKKEIEDNLEKKCKDKIIEIEKKYIERSKITSFVSSKESCINYINDPINIANNCFNLEIIRSTYNQQCLLTALPPPDKEIQSFATSDLQSDNHIRIMGRLVKKKDMRLR